MKIIFAGGGTAGHVEPALAIARLWQSKYPQDTLEFIGTAKGLENQLVPAANFKLYKIPKVVMPRKVSLSLFSAPLAFLGAIMSARRVVKGADLLIGFGGYVSAPAYLAAKSLGIAFVVHEANAKPGFANRLGARLTKSVAVAQPVAKGALSRALITGIPLRSDVAQALSKSGKDWAKARANAKSNLGFSPSDPLVLAFFGSQGSLALNSVIEKSLPTLLSSGAQLLHGVGKLNSLPMAQERYQATAYIEDMATAYLAADLIISRSGAISCSEINALGRYALFIPLPIGNGEQRFNASQVISQGRGEIIDQELFTPAWIANNFNRLLSKSKSSSISGSESDINASEKIVNLMEFTLSGKRR
jgi:UDP-N-acetylglucosamine--N-acetylmuramyl-(pentapeptide) pyrophosphoryl-undecaprenol N-acetylglucosamine transferase